MLPILSAAEIKRLEAQYMLDTGYTADHLMGRAANAFVHKYFELVPDSETTACVVSGPGMNGADGIAIARMLAHRGMDIVLVMVCDPSLDPHPAVANQLDSLPRFDRITLMTNTFPTTLDNVVIIDALFGIGSNRPITGQYAEAVQWINTQHARVISVDIPSGLPIDKPWSGPMVEANDTITFEVMKLGMLLEPYGAYCGRVHVVDIGIGVTGSYPPSPKSNQMITAKDFYVSSSASAFYAHKYSRGHVLIIAGSREMPGAALLCAQAAMRAGAGIVTLHVPHGIQHTINVCLPEVLVSADPHPDHCTTWPMMKDYAAICIGPGLGRHPDIQALLLLLDAVPIHIPLILDADALYWLSITPELLPILVCRQVILTPHAGEWTRMVGICKDEFENTELLRSKAVEWKNTIILKGAHTRIADADGLIAFNTTGNVGLATAGSGDVLAGIISGMLCSAGSIAQAARASVYLHGLCAELASENQSSRSLIASDLIKQIGRAFLKLGHV
jgi:ADP-dependent NAD(P)H-hydrate dehydratase / NAD(P)H-hydrate epimerase